MFLESESSPPGATPITYRPAVVSGEKAVEIAKTDGYFPVIDKEIDVFAIPSTTGKHIYDLIKF